MKYKEWQANKTANSWKTQLRKDINQIIKITSTYTEFLAIMRAKGYEIGNDALDETGGKYITFLPVGRERVIGGKEFKKNKNMDEKKLIDSRKYFIFKIRDLVNKLNCLICGRELKTAFVMTYGTSGKKNPIITESV
ncbi:hypothetical protein INP51_12665 [Blautia liquoris]|uniref:Uncharacterized protein n=1 Tax=Blautia liquoris TaxID=2779518 RepID=A0A7M2RFS1_9FIRM|nr:hypothetical protein [Blautia liquoris]QOV18841.1 hypothetical protein INP51_12665 [Blautia liquoris]